MNEWIEPDLGPDYIPREITFKPNPNGVTRILANHKELKTCIDPSHLREYRYNLGHQYNLDYAHHLIETIVKAFMIEMSETRPVMHEEITEVIRYLKKELGI